MAYPVRAYRYPGLPGSRVQFPSNDRLHDLGQSSLALPCLSPVGRTGFAQAPVLEPGVLDMLAEHQPDQVCLSWRNIHPF